MSVFEFERVTYHYPGDLVGVEEVSFRIEAGESIALLGANASGKSTLLYLMDGLYFPQRGAVRAFGRELTERALEAEGFGRAFRRQVGLLFQNSEAQLFSTTVEEELAFGPLQLGLRADEVRRRVDDTLTLSGIEHLRSRSPQALSGGEKKRVALASLLTLAPSVLLLDEPTSGLDPRSLQALLELLAALRGRGLTLVTATHDLSVAPELAERGIVLSEAHRVARDAPVAAVLQDMNLLLEVNLIHAHAHAHGSITHVHPHPHVAYHDHEHGS